MKNNMNNNNNIDNNMNKNIVNRLEKIPSLDSLIEVHYSNDHRSPFKRRELDIADTSDICYIVEAMSKKGAEFCHLANGASVSVGFDYISVTIGDWSKTLPTDPARNGWEKARYALKIEIIKAFRGGEIRF